MLTGGGIGSGVKTIHSDGKIIITGDVQYAGNYSKLYDVPKIIIYGVAGIDISCGVNRIDALLVTNGKVKTCSDSDDINSKDNSRQLIINGAIIAGNIEANRTYGAATGANSIIPAEIINFDPTLYMWGEIKKENEVTNAGLRTTYLHELSPRY